MGPGPGRETDQHGRGLRCGGIEMENEGGSLGPEGPGAGREPHHEENTTRGSGKETTGGGMKTRGGGNLIQNFLPSDVHLTLLLSRPVYYT